MELYPCIDFYLPVPMLPSWAVTPGRRPAVDDRLVDPEMNVEVIDGEVIPVSPAHEPHGDRHSKLASLLEASVAEGFNVAVDMLTRTDEDSDVAPDASIYPRVRDPETGGRRLEHLAFEVVSRQTLSHAGRKAQRLLDRGVRRIFAIDVERERLLEWLGESDGWHELDHDDVIEDDALAVPVSAGELAACVTTCDAVARMLLARKNAVLTAALDERQRWGEQRGEQRGERRAHHRNIVSVLTARGLSISDEQRRAIEAMTDLVVLERWVALAATCDRTADLLADTACHP